MISPDTLFRKAVDATLRGTTVVTPHDGTARALRHACELKMSASGKPWHTPRVLGWGAFINWLWREAIMAGALSRILLSREQQRVLWEQVLVQSSDAAGLMNLPGAANRARNAWDVLHAYRVPFPSAAFDRTPETKAFAHWAAEFARVCSANDWVDTARAADELARVPESVRTVMPSVLTYGFDDCTPQQSALLQAFRGAGISVEQLVYVEQLRLDGSGNHKAATQLAANDPEDEIRRAATWARVALSSKPSTRIGIVIPRLQDLRSTVERIFMEVLHPESFFFGHTPGQLAFELAAQGSLANEGVVDTALRVLQLASGTLSLEEACRLVRSPYLSGAEEERVERAWFDVALRRYTTPQINPADLMTEARKAKCPILTKHLAAFQPKCAGFEAQHASGKWADAMSDALTTIGWPGAMSVREYQAQEAFLEVLRRFSALEVVRPTKIAAVQALRELTRMARAQAFRPKATHAPVQVLDLDDTAGLVFDHLWICGMTDDAWPPRGDLNPFIPQSIQLQCTLPHSSAESDRDSAARLLSRLYASADEVVVSWPKRDKDRELRAAPQISRIPMAETDWTTPALPSLTAHLPFAAWEEFTDEQAPNAPVGLQAGGTKLFEFQSTCPFRAFGEKRLMARKLDDAYTGPSYIERGKIIERVLQRAWDELGNWHRLKEVFDTGELQHIILHAVDGAIRECIPQPGLWFDNYRTLERSRLNKIAFAWFEMERQRSPFDRVVHQQELEIRIGEITVKAIIDRIDHLPENQLVVIDYKSGDKNSARHWELPRMDSPQLPLYAVAQPPGSVSAVAFGIARTDRCDLAGYARSREILGKTSTGCERDMAREIASWRGELESLVSAYIAGDAAVNPKHPHKTCKWCHLGPLCRVKEQLAAEVRDDG